MILTEKQFVIAAAFIQSARSGNCGEQGRLFTSAYRFILREADQKNQAYKRKHSHNYHNAQVPNDQKFTRD
ncbi:MAG: hypothetical protein WBO39_15365 [Ferruginibacter sp.]